jgi:hypothetical protein
MHLYHSPWREGTWVWLQEADAMLQSFHAMVLLPHDSGLVHHWWCWRDSLSHYKIPPEIEKISKIMKYLILILIQVHANRFYNFSTSHSFYKHCIVENEINTLPRTGALTHSARRDTRIHIQPVQIVLHSELILKWDSMRITDGERKQKSDNVA